MAKFYLTTSIAYANAPPHIGFAFESIQADVVARYYRQAGFDVFFLTGTDEHGTKIARAAEAAGKKPRVFVDEIAEKNRALKNLLNLSWDDFIRTTDQKRHWPGVLKMWRALVQSGDIYKKQYQGLYCVGHEAFITEKDLVDGKCLDHGTKPEIINEENYFFRLSKYAREIEKRIKNDELKIIPETRKNEVLAFIKEGVEDISFSRPRKDLFWGIPAPDDETQTIYVWGEALTNYISAIGYGSDNEKNFRKYWPADLHMIGKDILRFHALIWPAMLLSTKLPLPKSIFVHGFITVEGKKMSKTLNNIVSPFELVEKYGVDAVRYYLLRGISPSEDGDFSYKKFEERYNADLANGLGNYNSRVLTLIKEIGEIEISRPDKEIDKKIKQTEKIINEKLSEFKFNEALAEIWGLIGFGDKYLNENEVWKIKDAGKKEEKLGNLALILVKTAEFLSPFLPQTSQKILSQIEFGKKSLKVKNIETLFPRIK